MAEDQEEKTEEATPKKVEDSKKEGNVPKSIEFVGAAVLFFGSLYLLFFSSHMMTSVEKMMRFTYGFIGEELDNLALNVIINTIISTFISALIPFFILVIIFAIAFNLMQFGFISTSIKFKIEKIDPIKGMGNVFSMRKLLEALKLSLKLIVIFTVMVIIFYLVGDDMLAMMDMSLYASIDLMIYLTGYFIAAIMLVIILFAIIDFYFTRYYYFKQLRMTKQEVKDEFKNLEGDPQVKARIRQIQQQMSRQRMMSSVPDADVVITNPTHYAVAMKYDSEKDSAPKVVAKGIDFIAQKIKDLAREHDVPIIENPALARALYEQVEIDEDLPQDFYKTLAEIFSYIYELKSNRR